jgi:hypothetical protein
MLGDETTYGWKILPHKISDKIIYPSPNCASGGWIMTTLAFMMIIFFGTIFGTGWVICQLPKVIKKFYKFAVA